MVILLYLAIGLIHLYYVEDLVNRNKDKGYKTRPIWIVISWPIFWIGLVVKFIKGCLGK